jgi:hypothetical protein
MAGMATFYHLTVAFSCPACRNNSTIESVIESKIADDAEAANSAKSLPLKCSKCNHLAPAGTGIGVNVAEISAEQFASWVQTMANQKRLHIHKESKPQN